MREVIDDDTTEFRGFFVEDEGGFQKPMEYWIGAMTFTPDGKTLITGSRDTTIKFFEMPQVSDIRTVRGHSGWVRSLAVSPDGKVLMSASDDPWATVRPPLVGLTASERAALLASLPGGFSMSGLE